MTLIWCACVFACCFVWWVRVCFCVAWCVFALLTRVQKNMSYFISHGSHDVEWCDLVLNASKTRYQYFGPFSTILFDLQDCTRYQVSNQAKAIN
jgi:hypothetical protein